jgi:subtilisin-like proprotein convertase family protein
MAGAMLLALILGANGRLTPAPAGAVPANNNFANAVSITSAITDPVVGVADTAGATTEAGEPSPCGSVGATAWYTWTSPASAGTATFNTFGSLYNTALAVYTGNAVNALTLVPPFACNDDIGGAQSAVTFNFAASTIYRIQAGGSAGATGKLVLNMSLGASMIVNTAVDAQSGDGFLSLREALVAASNFPNACAGLTASEQLLALNCGGGGLFGADLIHFSSSVFPPGAPVTIPISAELVLASNNDVLSGIGAGVIIDGQNIPFNCIFLFGNSNVVQGLDIRRCPRGIRIDGSFGNLIGIDISNSTPLPEERNIIRETGNGIRITNTGGGNVIYGNYIGTNPAGASGIGNGIGIHVENSSYQQIGFPGIGRNVISGNSNNGILLASVFQAGIAGNYVGTNPGGTAALPNGSYGILMQDTNATQIAGNVISGNAFQGIHILTVSPGISSAGDNVITGNYIGTNAAGTAAIPNQGGVLLQNAGRNRIGGTTPAHRNIMSGNSTSGIEVYGAFSTGNQIAGNYIGLDGAGAAVVPNVGNGVLVHGGASSNLIGGDTAGARNVISGNAAAGIRSTGPSSGLAQYASSDVPKAIPDLATATSTILIPAAARITDVNVTLDITHTFDGDLTLSLSNPDGIITPLSIRNGGGGDNYTNTTFDDMTPGIVISDGTPPFTGTWFPQGNLTQFEGGSTKGTWTLIVQDSAGADVGTINSWSLQFTAEGNQVAGNYIGTDATGTLARGNDRGVFVDDSQANTIGGSTAGERNVISGNSGAGLRLRSPDTQGNRVTGNFIGVGAGGNTDLGNGSQGILVSDGAANNTIGGGINERNVISGNGEAGVHVENVESTGNVIQGNYIGTNAAGSGDVGNSSHGVWLEVAGPTTVGVAGSGNVVSGNDGSGIYLQETLSTFIRGNFIGTNATGAAAIPNTNGMELINSAANQVGGPAEVERNVISGNTGAGVVIGDSASSGNLLQGNYVGTKADGVSPLGNGTGIAFSGGASGNYIGSNNPGEGNTIAHNTTAGISLSPAGGDPVDNRYYRNRIFDNGGLGIDLNVDGVTANDPLDADGGPNGRINFPELEYSEYVSGAINVIGDLNTTPNGFFDVQFFSSPACDSSGHGEGADFLGEASFSTDAVGHAAFTVSFPMPPLSGFITAVMIDDDATYNASEFSNCVPIDWDADDDGDGYRNAVEFGSIMCLGSANNDAFEDAVVNDGCPGGPAKVGTFSEAQFKVGTGHVDPCGADGWPSNVFNGGTSANKLNIQDVLSFVTPPRHLDKNPGEAGFDARWDLVPGQGILAKFINIADVTALVNGATGNPPMFNNTRAFDKTCPFPP